MQNTATVILGHKGSGKSFLTKEIARDRMRSGVLPRRIVAIDSLGEYGPAEGFELYEDDRVIDRLAQAAAGDRPFAISCRAVDESLEFDVLELAYECRQTLVIVEETSRFCAPTQPLPRELAQLVRYGRHREIDLIFIARRPSELHRDLTAQADVLISFEQNEPRDLQYLRAAAFPDPLQLVGLSARERYGFRVKGDFDRLPLPVLKRLHQRETLRATALEPEELDDGENSLDIEEAPVESAHDEAR